MLLFGEGIEDLVPDAGDVGIPAVGFSVAVGIVVGPGVFRELETDPILGGGEEDVHIAAPAGIHGPGREGQQPLALGGVDADLALAVDVGGEAVFPEQKAGRLIKAAGQVEPLSGEPFPG